LLIEQDTPVVFVHGIGGIGKSSLLEAFAAQVQNHGAVVIRLDCRAIKPSAEGFLQELTMAVGGSATDVSQITLRLSQLGERVILIFDNYEVYRMMDTWLRQVFIPALTDNVRVLFFGREAPVSAWFTTPGWQGLVQSIPLGPLSHHDSEELLLQCRVAETSIPRVMRFTHGHPLALKLAAAMIAAHPDLNLEQVESQHVVAELARLYLADVPDRVTQAALEAACVVRRTTRSLLSAMLPDIAPNDAYDRLQALPFVDSASDGLIVHDLVQQAIALRLRAADPQCYDKYRRAAWHQLRSEFSVGSPATIWRYTADMIYLIDHPGIHETFFPSDVHLFTAELATPEDESAIQAITLRHDGPETLAIMQHWWNVLPGAFHVARGHQAQAAGYYCVIHVQQPVDRLQFDDPLTRPLWRHLQSNPIPERQLALFALKMLAFETGENPSAVQGMMWLDLKRIYMEYPQTRRIYSIDYDMKTWLPVLEALGFCIIDSVTLDGKKYTVLVNDFGPQLVPGWMAGLVDAQLGVTPPLVLCDEARELLVGNQHVGLTRLEFNLMKYLVQHEGKAVSRDELLNTVWGYDYDGGSNVVDGMVRSLRKKMGDNAKYIESVAGVGYKLRWSN
jgi:Transcriptional regulatory protein, C terminal